MAPLRKSAVKKSGPRSPTPAIALDYLKATALPSGDPFMDNDSLVSDGDQRGSRRQPGSVSFVRE